MKSKERVVAALKREKGDYVPTFEGSITSDILRELTGSGSLVEAAKTLEVDGIVVKPDYTREYLSEDSYINEWGITYRKTVDFIDAIVETPIHDVWEYGEYAFPDPYAPHRFETLERAVREIGDEKAVILNLRDIFSDVRDLLGYENALIAVMLEQEHFAGLLEKTMEWNYTLAKIARERYGIEVVMTTDDITTNTGLLFSPKLYFDFFYPRFKRVISGFKDLGYLCVKHCDGDVNALLDSWIEAGVDCIDPVDPNGNMNLKQLKAKYGDRLALKGNVDCQGVLVSGTPAEVKSAARKCIEDAAKGGGYILSSSNSIHSGVPAENFAAMLEAVKEYGAY